MLVADFHFICSKCAYWDMEKGIQIALYSNIPWPTIPKGWHLFDGMLLCPSHTINIE